MQHKLLPAFVVDYKRKNPSFLERHIAWLGKPTSSFLTKTLKRLLASVEALALSLSIIGIPLLIMGGIYLGKAK